MLYILIGIALLAGLVLIVYYNRFVRLSNGLQEAQSGIEVQFKKRADLLPALVKTVKAYAAHEEGLLTSITQLRSSGMKAGSVQEMEGVQKEFNHMIGRLMVVAENYPNLKADANFRTLQEQLVGIEKSLEMARRYYNGTVRNLNNAVETFPGVLFAGLLGFSSAPFFETESASERSMPELNL